MASRPYLLKENSMSFLWRNDLRLKTFLFMDYSMSSSWMEGLDYFKYRSLGIFSLLGSTVYHDSAVNCGTLPSEEAFLLWCCSFGGCSLGPVLLAVLLLWRLFLWDLPFWRCCSFCKRSPFWKYCSFERVISFLEGSSLWEDYFLVIPFSLMKASRASPPSMLLTQSVRMLTFSGATTFSTFSVLALTQ